jgi:DNA ligase D-like protein (predicted polymerase)
MQIRRNTKAFKTILEIVAACQSRPDRQNLIRLYITKAGQNIDDRISIEGSASEAGFFYDLNYQAVLNHLKSSTHQLVQSDDVPGLYYFHGTISKDWDETPFEFDTRVKEEFSTLTELPATREKGKAKAFVLPDPNATTPTKAGKEKNSPHKAAYEKASKEDKADKPVSQKPFMVISKGPRQPDYKLKRDVLFTALDRIVFREAQLDKRKVLDHYNKIADYILPYLKDRPHLVRLKSESGPNTPYTNIEALPKRSIDEIPDWVQRAEAGDVENMFLCNDRDHLLFYVELGGIEFDPCHSRKNSVQSPDYLVIGIESGSDFAQVIDVALVAREILAGLQFPAFVKTDGSTGLHIYVPLDTKSEFDVCERVAEYVCKLIRLKLPDLVSLKDTDEYVYGKVTVDHTLNREGVGVVAPYSFAAGGSATIATPLLWEEVTEGLRVDEFNYETIFERLKKAGDPFENLFKKKINAEAQLERLEANYSFLF